MDNRTGNLELYDNRLTGTLPPTLGQMVELRHLHLDGNEFFGDLDRALTGFGQLGERDQSVVFQCLLYRLIHMYLVHQTNNSPTHIMDLTNLHL